MTKVRRCDVCEEDMDRGDRRATVKTPLLGFPVYRVYKLVWGETYDVTPDICKDCHEEILEEVADRRSEE